MSHTCCIVDLYFVFSDRDVTFFMLSVFTCEVTHHSVTCLMTGSQTFPRRVFLTVRCGVSSFSFHYPLVSLMYPVSVYFFFLVFLLLLSLLLSFLQ